MYTLAVAGERAIFRTPAILTMGWENGNPQKGYFQKRLKTISGGAFRKFGVRVLVGVEFLEKGDGVAWYARKTVRKVFLQIRQVE